MKTILALCFSFALAACGGGGSAVVVPAPGAPEAYVVSTYGDSTQEAQGHPHAASRPGVKIYNRGVSGTNSVQLLAGTDGVNYPWPKMMRQESAPAIVINHGINDRGYPLEQYRENLKSLVTQAQAAGKFVMLEEPNPAGETETPLMAAISFNVPEFEARRAAMREVAQALGVYFCAQPRVPLYDGIHPTPEGYAIKAARLAACLADAL